MITYDVLEPPIVVEFRWNGPYDDPETVTFTKRSRDGDVYHSSDSGITIRQASLDIIRVGNTAHRILAE